MTLHPWTQTQESRLAELGLNPADFQMDFSTPIERNQQFQKIEKEQVKHQKKKLLTLLHHTKKTRIQQLEEKIEQALYSEGFTRVSTPTIITKKSLKKMTIDAAHPLLEQVFWLNANQCLRPMLAPNLYSLMQDLGRLKQRPVRFFEIGPCFRKESSGARHANEFTMLNLVEMGTPEETRLDRLKHLAKLILHAAGIEAYAFENEDSAVYGSTLDVVAGKDQIEVASGAEGPHPLDMAWDITDTWVGMGFGMERLLMTARNEASIGRWSKNLMFLDGICLKI